MFEIRGLSTWFYVLLDIGCALILEIIIFAYCKIKKRWSWKLWRKAGFLKGGDGEEIPLVTINSSGDGNASRDTHPSPPMANSVYSTKMDRKDNIQKLYHLVIADPELTKTESKTD